MNHVKRVFEVGAGFGCSMYPLLEIYEFDYVATDFSERALEILQNHESYDSNRIKVCRWDFSEQYNLQENNHK